MNITYEEICNSNLALIKDIQHRIFPESTFAKGYDVLMQRGPSAVGNIMQTYFIAYVDGVPAGTYGLYIPEGVEEHASIWLGWYGILPEFRGKGIGKRILLDSMEKAKTYASLYPIYYYRLYTSETMNDSAQPLYNRVMTLKEYYRNPEVLNDENIAKVRSRHPELGAEQCRDIVSKSIAVFSKTLDENHILVPWDNYYMALMKTVALEEDTRTR